MAQLLVNDIVLVSARGTLNGQRIINTFWYRVKTQPVGGALEQQAAFTAFMNIWGNAGEIGKAYKDVFPENGTINEWRWQVVSPTRYRGFIFTINQAGLGPVAALTSNNSASIERYAEKAGRKYVGGIRVPIGLDSEYVTGGILQTAYLTLLNDLAAKMVFNFSQSSYVLTPVIGPGVDVQGNFRDVVGTSVQTTARVMRRRTVGLGE